MIKNILSQLETASSPVAKAIRKTEQFKVIAIGFKKGMILKEHKTAVPAKLTVLYGTVVYQDDTHQQTLYQYDEIEIPVNVLHAVTCIEDALCLLIQG